MRLTDFLSGPAARQVQYYPRLVPILGSVTATILFGQLLYWMGKEADSEGWIYKSQAEISEETALTRDEQESARKKLRDAGVLKEQKRGIPCRLWFLLNLERVNNLWEKYQQNSQYGQKPQTSLRESPIQVCGNASDKPAAFPQTTTLDYTVDYAVNNNNKVVSSVVVSTQSIIAQVEAVAEAIPPQQRSQKLLELVSQLLEQGKTAEHLIWRIEKAHQKAAKDKVCGYLRKDLEALLMGEDWHAGEMEIEQTGMERRKEVDESKRLAAEATERERRADLQRQAQLLQRLERLPQAEQELIRQEAAARCREFGTAWPVIIQAATAEIIAEKHL